jgi:hypothetical protein
VNLAGGDRSVILSCNYELHNFKRKAVLRENQTDVDTAAPMASARQDPEAFSSEDDTDATGDSDVYDELRQLPPGEAEACLYKLLDARKRGHDWCARLESLIEALGGEPAMSAVRLQAEARLRYERIDLLLQDIGRGEGIVDGMPGGDCPLEGERLLQSLLPDLIPDIPLSKAMEIYHQKDSNLHETVAELLQLQVMEKAERAASAPRASEKELRTDGRSLADELEPRGDYSPPYNSKARQARQRSQHSLLRLSREVPQLSRDRLKTILEAMGGDHESALAEAQIYCEQHGISGPGVRQHRGGVLTPYATGSASRYSTPRLREVMRDQEARITSTAPQQSIAGVVSRLQQRFPDLTAANIRRELQHNDNDERATAQALMNLPPTRNMYAGTRVYDISTPRARGHLDTFSPLRAERIPKRVRTTWEIGDVGGMWARGSQQANETSNAFPVLTFLSRRRSAGTMLVKRPTAIAASTKRRSGRPSRPARGFVLRGVALSSTSQPLACLQSHSPVGMAFGSTFSHSMAHSACTAWASFTRARPVAIAVSWSTYAWPSP